MEVEIKNVSPSWVLPALGMAILSAATGIFLYSYPTIAVSWDMFALLGVILVIFILLYGSLTFGATRRWRIPLLLWWILLVSEEVFSRFSTSEKALNNEFMFSAYSEAIIWLIVFAFMFIYTLGNRRYLRTIWSGSSRLLLAFALVCMLSCAYTPQPEFAIAWAFKLLLAVLVILACKDHLSGTQEISGFLRVTLWAYAFLAVLPLLRALLNPAEAFSEGRLSQIASPTGLSLAAGTLFLLALMSYSPTRRKESVLLAGVGLSVMLFSGGKTGLVGGIVSAILFFALQKKFGAVVRLLAAVSILGVVVLLTTPVGQYFEFYRESGQVETASGRLDLWSFAVPAILHRPIWGYGYMASRFVAIKTQSVSWDAGHMHNGFLEALYNGGVIALLCIVLMHATILKHLIRTLRYYSSTDPHRYRIAVGCLALYTNLLINGMFNASFGGRAEAAFMLLLALVIVAELLANATYRAGLEPAPGRA
jgi:O-antigen ligase